jgi:hypothetical protein
MVLAINSHFIVLIEDVCQNIARFIRAIGNCSSLILRILIGHGNESFASGEGIK